MGITIFNPEMFCYRLNGRPVLNGMAVVIQEMVAADSAGVIFTRNPVTGDPTKIVITANYGLGEVGRHAG